MRTKELFGIKFSTDENLKKQSLASHKLAKNREKERLFPDMPPYDFTLVDYLWSSEDLQHYYMTNEVMQLSVRVKLPDPLKLEWLISGRDGKRQFNYGDSFIRYVKKDSLITVLAASHIVESNGTHRMPYAAFTVDIANEKIIVPEDDFSKAALTAFFQMYIFTELTDIEEEEVRPGKKSGTRSDNDQLKNDELFTITKIKTNWVKTLVSNNAIDVTGYLRIQRYGPGNEKRKLIWISPHTRRGFTIRAGKIIDEENGYNGN